MVLTYAFSNNADAMQDTIKTTIKEAPKLIRSIVPRSSFTEKDLTIDERQKVLLKNARPLNIEKNLYELKENARKESWNHFYKDQFSLVTKNKPKFIDKSPKLAFLNSFFDNRMKINSCLQYPYTCIAYLEATESLNNSIVYWRGSGFLIGERILLTAKHCVESPVDENDTISFNALFGKTGNAELFDTKGIQIYKHPKRDIALVLLEENIGLKVGSLGLSKDLKEKQKVSVIGYPGVKTFKSYFKNSGETEMYGMTGPVLTITTDGKVTYSLDTSGGQSGGPVSNILTKDLKEYTAYGVHTKGATDYNLGEVYDNDFEEFILSGEKTFLDFLSKK